MQIELNDLFTFLFSFFGGGGLGFIAIKLFMQNFFSSFIHNTIVSAKTYIKAILNINIIR